MTSSEEVIALNHTKIRENMIVLHTLSRNYGRKSFLIRIGQRTGMSYFLPLNVLELAITENRKSDLWFAKVVSATYPLTGIRKNLYKNAISLFMAEVLYRTIKEGSREDGLYEWCVHQALVLDALTADFSNYPIWFLLGLCRTLGFRPESSALKPFSGENQSILEKFIESELPEAMLVPLNGQQRNELAASLIKYLEFHTESKIDVRSLAVLREVFSTM